MKPILKKFLLIGEAVAGATVPGAGAIDAAIHATVQAKTGVARETALVQAAIATLNLVEQDLGVSFADEPDFQSGILLANAGLLQIVKALNKRQANPT